MQVKYVCNSCADAGSAATDKFDEWAEPPKIRNAILAFIKRYAVMSIYNLHEVAKTLFRSWFKDHAGRMIFERKSNHRFIFKLDLKKHHTTLRVKGFDQAIYVMI